MKRIFRHWKIVYVICCLVYAGWMIKVGGNEFDRINGQFRQLTARLEPARIREAALAELADECRRALPAGMKQTEAVCSDWAPEAVTAQTAIVEERRTRARQRGAVKLVLFYTGFGLIFLLAPMILVYLLITALILLYKNIKIVRR